MKMFARKSLFRSLATACFVGSTCCSSLLLAQQETASPTQVQEALPPIVSSNTIPQPAALPVIATPPPQQELAPIVSGAKQPTPAQPIEAANLSGQGTALPPVVSVDQLMANEGTDIPVVPANQMNGAENSPVPVVSVDEMLAAEGLDIPVVSANELQEAAIDSVPVVAAQNLPAQANPQLPVQEPVPVMPAPRVASVPVNNMPLAMNRSGMPGAQPSQVMTPRAFQQNTNMPLAMNQDAAAPQNQNHPMPIAQQTQPQAPQLGMESTDLSESVPVISKGANFPADGEMRIAKFIEANRMAEMANSSEPAANPAPVAPVKTPAAIEGSATASEATPQIVRQTAPTTIPQPPTPNIVSSPSVQRISQPSINYVQPGMVPAIPASSMPSIGGQAVVGNQQPAAINTPVIVEPNGPAVGEGDYFETIDPNGTGYQAEVMVDYGQRDSMFDCCGFVRPARNYFIFDTLNWQRNDGVFRASNITNIDDYDFTAGGKVTWGKKRDSTRGHEIVYMQFDPWIAATQQNNAAGTLIGAVFGNPANNLPPNAFTAFRNGTFAEQFHKTELRSLELNRTWWGSDVAKAFIGTRFINFEDDFRLSMANNIGETGTHTLSAENNLIGLHTGMEVLYDIGYRLSFSYGAKIGGYANFYENSLVHINAGAVRAANFVDNTDFSWNAEFGVWTRYKLTPNVRLRAGYEVMGLFEVFESQSTYSTIVSSSNPNLFNQGDAWFHGLSFGFEIYR